MAPTANRLNEGGTGADATARDPVDELRDRYARGEIDEAEFERRLEGLLETEGLDTEDEAAVERAVERLSEPDKTDAVGAGGDVERERE